MISLSEFSKRYGKELSELFLKWVNTYMEGSTDGSIMNIWLSNPTKKHPFEKWGGPGSPCPEKEKKMPFLHTTTMLVPLEAIPYKTVEEAEAYIEKGINDGLEMEECIHEVLIGLIRKKYELPELVSDEYFANNTNREDLPVHIVWSDYMDRVISKVLSKI